MAKTKLIVTVCTNCKAPLRPGLITCSFCGTVRFADGLTALGADDGICRLSEVTEQKIDRLKIGIADRNWGPEGDEGIAFESVTLLGGPPGAGKSTLLLQILAAAVRAYKIRTGEYRDVLLAGAEEGKAQVKARALRLKIEPEVLEHILIFPIESMLAGHKIEPATFDRWKPGLVVLDSIQKYAATANEQVDILHGLKEMAVKHRCPGVAISQVNKKEEFAGLNEGLHEVDALMMFSSAFEIVTDRGVIRAPPDPDNPTSNEPLRFMQTTKNRNGDLAESYFTMHGDGLRPFQVRGRRIETPELSEEDDEPEDDELEDEEPEEDDEEEGDADENEEDLEEVQTWEEVHRVLAPRKK